MNVHVSYKVQKTPDIEKEISHQIEKIRKRLRVFKPELVHLKAVLEESRVARGSRRFSEFAIALGPACGGEESCEPDVGDQSRV